MGIGEGWVSVSAQFTPEMLKAIDGFAEHAGIDRNEAIRSLVGLAFNEAGLQVF